MLAVDSIANVSAKTSPVKSPPMVEYNDLMFPLNSPSEEILMLSHSMFPLTCVVDFFTNVA